MSEEYLTSYNFIGWIPNLNVRVVRYCCQGTCIQRTPVFSVVTIRKTCPVDPQWCGIERTPLPTLPIVKHCYSKELVPTKVAMADADVIK